MYTVAERSILFLLYKILKFVSNLLERLFVRSLKIEVHQGIQERTPHEKLK